MKKIALSVLAVIVATFAHAQSSVGLIAHWNMDSSVNDISGGGHHGTAVGLVPAAGIDSIPGHAYYFDGITSVVTVPYSPAFNVSRYSICATVMADGFYGGTCQHNIIFTRGKTGTGTGNFCLSMIDDQDCINFDSTTEYFLTQTEYRSTGIAPYAYTPAIVAGAWYKIVATFDDTAYRVYVNGALRNMTLLTTPGIPLGTCTDGINIGLNTFEALYPYGFKGYIDDIRFYDRALTDTESIAYTYRAGSSTAIANVITSDMVSVAPNPAEGGTVTIKLPYINGAGTIQMINTLGQVVVTKDITSAAIELNIEHLPPGIYTAVIRCNAQSIYKKIQKL